MSEISIVTRRTATPIAAVRRRVRTARLSDFFAETFPAVERALAEQDVSPIGPALAKYRGRSNATVDVEAGYPIDRAFRPTRGVVADELPSGRVVQAVHAGSYDSLHDTYARIAAYFDERGLNPSDIVWEEYVDDPSTATDPSRLRTVVNWLIA